LTINGKKTVKEFHRDLGHIMWEDIGMSRNESGLKHAVEEIRKLREEFWQNVNVAGTSATLNKNLEFAGRVADYLELGELMASDALHRAESCGGHFREESQTEDHEAKRDDENFAFVSAWEYKGDGVEPALHKEQLTFENVKLTTRSYK
jgi:succinate dehydrogenase / fumarate reductase flavoprotein subunit